MKPTLSEISELNEIQAGLPPYDMTSEKQRVRLKHKGLVYRETEYPWTWHLTDKGKEYVI
jgi:hypothetical protein